MLMERLRAHFELMAAEFGLTPTQAMALRLLKEPLPMGRLAELLHCERSNVTLVVDRLAERGVLERRADPGDRRVRHLVLTEEGWQLRHALEQRLFEQVPAVAGLEEEERLAFRDLLRTLTPDDEEDGYRDSDDSGR